jgi:hypothetical protein
MDNFEDWKGNRSDSNAEIALWILLWIIFILFVGFFV